MSNEELDHSPDGLVSASPLKRVYPALPVPHIPRATTGDLFTAEQMRAYAAAALAPPVQFTEAEMSAEPRIYLKPNDYERRDDGKVVRKDRWEWGVRNIVTTLWGSRHAFEIDDVVDRVRELAAGNAQKRMQRTISKLQKQITDLKASRDHFQRLAESREQAPAASAQPAADIDRLTMELISAWIYPSDRTRPEPEHVSQRRIDARQAIHDAFRRMRAS